MKRKLTTPDGTDIDLKKVMAIKVDTRKANAELIFVNHSGRDFLKIGNIPLSILHLFMNVINSALNAFVNRQKYSPDWSFLTSK